MLRYAIETKGLNRALSLFSRLFDTRATFFDLDGRELSGFDIKKMSPYCGHNRLDPAFDRRCIECDRTHLARARRSGSILVYRCHVGLLEAVVPLHDARGAYLGALMFGQMRPRGRSSRSPRAAPSRLYDRLPEATDSRVRDMAELARYVSEHIIRQELVRRRGASVKRAARELGFYDEFHFSKRFKVHFGMPPGRVRRD